jgi:citrate lyase subunit beta/citryl-CoA lyase
MSDIGLTRAIAAARTLLFVTGDRPDRFAAAAASGADGIVLDLEDGVGPAHKAEARDNVRRWRAHGGDGVVRINGPDSDWYLEDLSALGDRPSAVMLPKAASAAQVGDVLERLPHGSCVVPILETAVGVLDARSICAAAGVVRAAFGNGDLSTQLGVHHADRDALAHARSAIVLASAAAGVAAPLDGVATAVADESTLIADAEDAAALGFTGKLCIHPRQVAPVHRVFAPSLEQVRWAREMLLAAGDGSARVLRGELVDRPIVERARRLLARAGEDV